MSMAAIALILYNTGTKPPCLEVIGLSAGLGLNAGQALGETQHIVSEKYRTEGDLSGKPLLMVSVSLGLGVIPPVLGLPIISIYYL